MVRSQTDEIVVSQIRGIVEKGLGHLFILQVLLISSIKPILINISLQGKNRYF